MFSHLADGTSAPSVALYLSAWPLLEYTLCAPLLVVFLLIFLMVVHPSKSHDHNSKFHPCKRLHAIFMKAGLEPPLSPFPPIQRLPVFRIHITPAPPGLLRSKTGSVHGRRHSTRYRLPAPDFKKVMEDIWESPEEEPGREQWV